MNKLRQFWMKEGLHFRTGSGLWLGILRIGVGITIIAKIVCEYKALSMLYGSHGLIPPELSTLVRHGILPSFSSLYHATQSFWTEDAFIKTTFIAYLAFAVLLTLGLFTRISAIICWLLQLTVVNSAYLTGYGMEYVLLSLLFYTMLFPTGRYYSIDRLFWRKAEAPDPLLKYYHLTLQVHLCIIYLATGVAKLWLPGWHGGSYLWAVSGYPQHLNSLTQISRQLLAIWPMASILSWITILIEIVYPVLIWFRRSAPLLLILIILMHIYIAVVLGIWLFAWLMIVFNLAAFGAALNPKKITTDPKPVRQ